MIQIEERLRQNANLDGDELVAEIDLSDSITPDTIDSLTRQDPEQFPDGEPIKTQARYKLLLLMVRRGAEITWAQVTGLSEKFERPRHESVPEWLIIAQQAKDLEDIRNCPTLMALLELAAERMGFVLEGVLPAKTPARRRRVVA